MSRILVVFIALTWWLIPTLALAGEGDPGQPQVVDQPVGAYRLWVWTSPDPAQVGPVQVVARLETADGQPATDASVVLYARAPHRDVLDEVMQVEDGLYRAEVDIPYAATWTLTIEVGGASQSFPLEVQPRPIDKNLIRLAAGVTLVFFGIGWWFWGRHPRKKKVRKRIFMPWPEDEE